MPAQTPQVELRDGTKVEVFEHGMSLSIVALRGSVPTQWVMDFRSTLGKYSGFGLGQRRQLLDIFQVGFGGGWMVVREEGEGIFRTALHQLGGSGVWDVHDVWILLAVWMLMCFRDLVEGA